jgi:uncharacterized RDD family membrane protein YckC
MPVTEPRRIGFQVELKPHAYDPAVTPELFEGVLARRVIAFFIDLIILTLPVLFATLFILIFGVVTLGLGWLLFWLLWPAAVLWAVLYYGFTLGSPRSATLGMRAAGVELRTWYGAPGYFVLGAMHGIAFWVLVSMLTPLILLICFFNARRRLLHDILLGTIVINSDARAAAERAAAEAGTDPYGATAPYREPRERL